MASHYIAPTNGDSMKIITLLFFFIAVNSYAAYECSPEMQALQFNEHGYTVLRKKDDHLAWTNVEKKMIYKVVALQEYLQPLTESEALEIFGDFYEGEQGFNAGEITYFRVGRKIIAQVRYWPGDNEYGAFVEVIGSQVLVHAEIGDGEINCL